MNNTRFQRLICFVVFTFAFGAFSRVKQMHATDDRTGTAHELQSLRELRNEWQRTQDSLQKQLADKQSALEKLEKASDMASRDEQIERNSEVMLQSGKSGYADAVNEALTTGDVSWGAVDKAISGTRAVNKAAVAQGEQLNIVADNDALLSQQASLQKEITTLQNALQLTGAVIAQAQAKADALEASIPSFFHSLGQQVTNMMSSIASAFQRQEARRVEEARKAEEARRAAEAAQRAQEARQRESHGHGPPDHPTRGDSDRPSRPDPPSRTDPPSRPDRPSRSDPPSRPDRPGRDISIRPT